MIYTEYFAKGSQPSGICQLHPHRGFLDRIAGVFGENDAPRPVSAEDVGLTPAAPASTTGGSSSATPAPPNAPTPPKAEDGKKDKKPGFWGRLFGKKDKGDEKKDDKKDDKKDPPKKKTGGGF
jgi:hypothetical protein